MNDAATARQRQRDPRGPLPAIRFRAEVIPSDPGTIRRLVASTGFFSRQEIAIAVELAEERLAKGAPSGYEFLFAERDGGEVAGYTCFGEIPCTVARYDLYWIAVLDDFRGLGIGKSLMRRTEERIAQLGGRRIYIETSARDQYLGTRIFYERCGFREEAILKDFYAPGDHKAIYLKELSAVSR
ncbi:MAG: GNAT family N-acetyltransferase [bacterium]